MNKVVPSLRLLLGVLCAIGLSTISIAESVSPASSKTENWLAGAHYIQLIPPPAPAIDPAPSKIKVVVLRYYLNQYMRSFEKAVQHWTVSKPADIDVSFQRGVYQPCDVFVARADWALRALDHEDLLPDRYYDWIWDRANYPIYSENPYQPDAAAIDRLNFRFASINGVSEEAFRNIYYSPAVEFQLIAAPTLSQAGSMVFINNKYATTLERAAFRSQVEVGSEENFERMFKLIEYLAQLERDSR